MIDLKPEFYAALKKAVPDVEVSYYYPSADAKLPCVSYYEIENRVHTQADAKEALTEIAFIVDIWSKKESVNSEKALFIDAELSALGFRRMFAQSLYEVETGIHHKTMRYRAISDEDKNITQ